MTETLTIDDALDLLDKMHPAKKIIATEQFQSQLAKSVHGKTQISIAAAFAHAMLNTNVILYRCEYAES